MGAPVIETWATETNFPAGSNLWNGQPCKVAPSGDLFTPNVKIPAEFLNYKLNKMCLVDAALQAWHGGTVRFNPQYAPSAGSYTHFHAMAYDPVSLKWLLAGLTGGGDIGVATGRGSDAADWVNIVTSGSMTGFVNSVCRGIEPGVTPVNKYVYLGYYDSGNAGHLGVVDTNAVTITNVALAENTNVSSVKVVSLSGAIIIAIGGTSSAISHVDYTANQGTTITVEMSATRAVPYWLLAQTSIGGGTVMTIPGTTGGSQTNATAGLDVATTTDGHTWTITTVTSLIGSTEVPVGLTYGADASGVACWYLVTSNSGILNAYRSYNGTVWTAVISSLSSIGVALAVGGLAALGSMYVGVVADSSTASDRVVCSVDGGVTWTLCNSSLALGGSTLNSNNGGSCLAAGPNSVMAWSQKQLLQSEPYGPNPLGFGSP